MNEHLELADWRRQVQALYARVREERDPGSAHDLWRATRDSLFRNHPQSPLLPDDPLRETGIGYWDYRDELRFRLPVLEAPEPLELSLPSGADGDTPMRRIGQVELPSPFDARVDVWWLMTYGGGLFLPLKDASAGTVTYGGGRYLLDTTKGADLGGEEGWLVIDLNFLYHPSCRYNPRWQCPLAPPGNTIASPIPAGELL